MSLFEQKQSLPVRVRRQAVGATCQVANVVLRNASGGIWIGFAVGANQYTKNLAKRQERAVQQRRSLPKFSWTEMFLESSDFALVGGCVGLAASTANGVIRWITD